MAAANRLWQRIVAVAGWPSAHQAPISGRPKVGHHRSLSSILRSASPKPSSAHVRSNSTTESSFPADIASRSLPSTPQPRRLFVTSPPPDDDDSNDLSTLPDPRSRAMSPANGDGMASPPHHPDLDNEVATLSTKLINAINHQTALDDNLSAARLELEKSRDKVRQLEAVIEEQREMLAGDVWVRRKAVEEEKAALVARAAEEKRARLDMEQQKKKIEQELENLTAALFEEANKMVISAKEDARIEQEALQRKNDQLRAQLADTEGLLRSQQEQLAELKNVMEQIAAEKEEQLPPTLPSSPGCESFDGRDTAGSLAGTRHTSLSVPLSPSYPTSFTHLLQPVLRTDLAAFADFKDLLRTSKRLSAPRLPSGSSGSGLASLAIGLGSASSHVSGSTASLPTVGSPPAAATSPQTPNTPASSVGSISSAPTPTPLPLPHLKETKFYKRALTEDIEPTLRLDTAPGLSWLARRSVLASMAEGSLVVEPTPATAAGRFFGRVIRPELHACALCGEARREEEHLRTHRFRIHESDSASLAGYPLCRFCLGRVRSTCEFLGFLRVVKDGHWRAEDEDAERAAWEECVRLREQMFWCRMGGGVVPVGSGVIQQQQGQHGRHMSGASVAGSLKSPRPSQEGATPRPLPELPPRQFLELPRTPPEKGREGVVEAAAQQQPADGEKGIETTSASEPISSVEKELPQTPAAGEPAAIDPQPAAVEPQPAAVDTQLAVVDPQPAASEAQPAAVEPQSTAVEPQSAAVDTQPAAVDPQPAIIEAQPAAVEPQPDAHVVVEDAREEKKHAPLAAPVTMAF